MISFHILTLNFILVLSNDEFNAILTVVDKFIKRITLISEKITWIAEQWTEKLFKHLVIVDWRLLRVFISNRNKKFMLTFWKTLFKKLKIQLLYLIVYHSQTDEQTKQTNQIIKIILCHFFSHMKDLQCWFKVLFLIQ